MNRFIKRMYITMGALILITLCFGLLTRKSFRDSSVNPETCGDAEVSLSEINDDILTENIDSKHYFDNDIDDYDELFGKSDLIVVGKVEGKREVYNQAYKTKFRIHKIIKDESSVNLPETIYVFEPSLFNFDAYEVGSGYNLMLDNTDYILFLKHLEVPEGYHYKKDEAITFLPVSSCFGKYALNDRRREEVIPSEEGLTYQDVKDMGLLAGKQDIVDTYNAIKYQINEKVDLR